MSINSSAIASSSAPLSRSGLGFGLLGVVAFSFTVPLTKIAVGGTPGGGLDPIFVGAARAVVAAVLALLVLAATRTPLPSRTDWLGLMPIAAGVVIGFPMLTSLAMRESSSGHAAVLIGVLPAATAVVVVWLVGERPSRRFWIGAACGALVTVGFAIVAAGISAPVRADFYLLAAVALAAVGYAQGGRMSRRLGSWQTICWALVLALPPMTVTTVISSGGQLPAASPGQWAAFGYLSVVSMFLGFFAWYRGLAIGPMTTISQVQLVQPVFTLAWSVLLLAERPGIEVYLGAVAVIVCAAVTVRSRIGVQARPSSRLSLQKVSRSASCN